MSSSWLDPAWAVPAGTNATIVFVHGALVRGWEMNILRRRMRKLGYQVRQFRYRSMLLRLEENAQKLKRFLNDTPGDVLHLVGHSMGGVLIRRVFEDDPDPRPGRLIAIGSPLLDCWVARRFQRMHRRVGPLLIGRTVTDHLARAPDPVWHGKRDFGILAGTYRFGVGAIFSTLPSPSDGVVLLEETMLKGIRDRADYRLNHFGMLFSRRCTAQIARFLATGRFEPSTMAASAQNGCVETKAGY
jgi:pimeloyl-ACP methyl ester carboxylesterase